jgi:hypothetical protein
MRVHGDRGDHPRRDPGLVPQPALIAPCRTEGPHQLSVRMPPSAARSGNLSADDRAVSWG